MSEPELNDIWASEVVRLRDERDRLKEALECARYALTHRESDQTFAVCAIDAALTPAGQRLTPNEAME